MTHKMYKLIACLALTLANSFSLAADNSQPLTVIASNHAIALLAKSVVAEDGDVYSLLQAGQTPHDFALKFSDRKRLSDSHLIVWVGADLEPYLEKVASSASQQLQLAPLFPQKHKHSDDHHDHSGPDMHLWLDPLKAGTIAEAIAGALGKQQPHLRDALLTRAETLKSTLKATDQSLRQQLESISPKRFGVSHNAYNHFIQRYQLPEPLLLSHSTESPPGVRQLLHIRRELPEGSCLLVEPEHAQGWPQQLAQRQGYRLEYIDTLASNLDYPDYHTWLATIAEAFTRCLGAPAEHTAAAPQ